MRYETEENMPQATGDVARAKGGMIPIVCGVGFFSVRAHSFATRRERSL